VDVHGSSTIANGKETPRALSVCPSHQHLPLDLNCSMGNRASRRATPHKMVAKLPFLRGCGQKGVAVGARSTERC
jgi:hypothetical protein